MNLSIIEKVDLLNNRIKAIEVDIVLIQEGVQQDPSFEKEGQITRQQVIENNLMAKQALINEKNRLTNIS